MKRSWLKGLLLAVVIASPLSLYLLQSCAQKEEQNEHDAFLREEDEEEREGDERSGEAKGIAWYMAQRAYGLGYIPQDAEIHAVEYVRTRMIPELAAHGLSLQKSTAGQLNWEYLGPGNIGGRLRGLLVHPTNPNILYAGSVSGGVWKSTNAGASWFPTMNDLITLNISALAMKPGAPNTLYAGTGEGFLYGDNLPGRGILKTTDGGNIWKRVHVAQGLNSPFIMAIAVSPANPNVVYAAGRQAVARPFYPPAETVPDSGVSAIFKSTDSGETWSDITTGKGIDHNPSKIFDNFATEVVVSPTDANVIYAAFGLYIPGGIWKSMNGGQTWSRLTNGLPDASLPNMGYSRIKLAPAPSNANIIYASFAYSSKQGDTVDLKDDAMLGIWKTVNAGQSWTQVTTPLTINQFNRNNGNTTALGSQGGYAHALIVHPTDPNIVFVAGLDIYKTTNGGNTWSQISMWIAPGDPDNPENLPYVHADHHAFAFDLSTNPPVLYNGNDGGVARSRDLGKTWEILNHDFGVTQFYAFAVHPTNPGIMLGGTQDNGIPMLQNADANAWTNVNARSDGWQTYFDYADPTRIYVSQQNVGMGRIVFDYTTGQRIDGKPIGANHGSNGITQRDVDKAAFYAPYELSPNNPSVLVLGTNRLLKTSNRGDSWTPISAEFDSAFIAVAIAEGNDNIIWAANIGQIYKTENNGATYTNVTRPNLPKRYITDIEFDPSNRNTVYLTYSGYGTPHVFKTTNAGGSWTNISNNLPDIPANAIQVHPLNPNLLVLGTDIGVFLSGDAGQTWVPSTNGLPTVQVAAIELNIKANRIYAATHGRGAYSTELSLSAPALSVNANELQIQTRPNQTGEASFTISNTGNAELSFNIATSGGQAHELVGEKNGAHTSLSSTNGIAVPQAAVSSFGLMKKKPVGKKRATNDRLAKLNGAFALAQTESAQSNDMLVLDDGNSLPDNFIGEGPGSFDRFYWMNQFDLAQDFLLKGFELYMRTEALNENTIEIAVMDDQLFDLVRGDVSIPIAPSGGWFIITLTNPIPFKAGDTFHLEVGANNAIAYPAGADQNAQVPQRSFHYNWVSGDYDPIGAVAGYANGAYLIRAFGTKSGGANQPPVARRQISKTSAKVGETITFDASQSSDPDGQIVKYLWEFGDNVTSDQMIATHAYTRPGNFSPTLTVTDDKGATGQAIGFITISPGETSRIAATPTNGTIASNGALDIRITFNAQGVAEGNYQGQIIITSNGGNKTIPVQIRVSNASSLAELIYDNGVATKSYNWANAGRGSAVRMTPANSTAKLKQAKIYLHDLSEGNQFNLRILAAMNGRPSNTLHGPVPITAQSTGWLTIDLSAANLAVPNDFFVMIEYNGASKPSFGAENAAPLEQRSWDFNGSVWSLYDAEDYLIRAVVEYTTTDVEERTEELAAPKTFALAQNYPNPFAANGALSHTATTIKYQLPAPAQVELTVYDLTGRRITTLTSGIKEAGEFVAQWEGRDDSGAHVASGVYFYRLTATSAQGKEIILTRKLALVR